MKNLIQKCFLILGVMFGQGAMAEEKVASLGEIAEKLTLGTDTLTQLMLIACLTVGIGMVILSVGMYRSHRQNPKFVPLDKAIIYLVLGLLLLAVPFLDRIFGLTGSTIDLKKKQAILHHDIDAPLRPAPSRRRDR